MNDELKQDDGVSLGQLFSWLWRKKIIGLIVFLAVAVVCFVIIFLISNAKAVYSISFNYGSTPNLSENKFLNNTSFNYLNLISKNTLTDVKNSSDEFKNIDIDKVSNSISITENKVYTNDTLDYIYYVIEVKPRAFNSANEAKKFLIELSNWPIKYNDNFLNLINFNSNFDLIKPSLTYEDELSYIDSQVNLIKNGYEDLIEKFGDNYVSINENGENSYYYLSQLLNIFNANLNNFNYSMLEAILDSNHYVKLGENNDTSYYDSFLSTNINALKTQKDTLDKQKEALNNQINSILSQISGNITSSALDNLINSLSNCITQLSEVEKEISNLEATQARITEQKGLGDNGFAEDKEFGETLNNIVSFLQEETTLYSTVYKEIYSLSFEIIYTESSVVVSSGGISMVINAGISIILGLVVGAITATILGYNSEKKELLTKKEEEIKA